MRQWLVMLRLPTGMHAEMRSVNGLDRLVDVHLIPISILSIFDALPTRPSRRRFGKGAAQVGGATASTRKAGLGLAAEFALAALVAGALAFGAIGAGHVIPQYRAV